MQPTGARQLREDDYRKPSPARRLRAVSPDGSLREADEHSNRAPEAGTRHVDDGYAPVYADNGRRTVTITGHPVPPRRRPSPAQSQLQARPDRIALWAFLLGLFLVFMAVATANAAAL